MVLYRGLHPINMHKVCDNIIRLFFSVPTSLSSFSHSVYENSELTKVTDVKKGQRHNIYEKQTKTALKNGHFWEAKKLLGSVTMC